MQEYTSLNANSNEQDTLYNRRGLAPGFERFAEILNQDDSVLDVGCGPGSVTIKAKRNNDASTGLWIYKILMFPWAYSPGK